MPPLSATDFSSVFVGGSLNGRSFLRGVVGAAHGWGDPLNDDVDHSRDDLLH